MVCPNCSFKGEFAKKQMPVLVFSLWDSIRERLRTRRTVVCPQCGTEIILPKAPKHNAKLEG